MMMFLLILIILILISVAFYTLMERKIMSMNQLRLGPNKVLLLGILQPVIDGLKLFLKMINSPRKNVIFFFFSPMISFIIMMIFWSLFVMNNIFLKGFILLFLFGISVYSFVLSGWSSFSKFGYLGGMRASCQTVSYEVGLSIIFMLILIFFKNFNLLYLKENYIWIFIAPILIIWILITLVETNRAPFDFSEGESELISGFNIEYGSGGFVLFFLAEYSMMIFLSILTMLIFSMNMIFFFLMLFIFIVMRTTFPRFRYDFLMKFLWFKLLPFMLIFFMIMINF